MVEHEAAVRRAVPEDAVRIELHLEEPLAKKSFGFGSVTVPPNQNVGPTAETGTAPSVGSTKRQVTFDAEPGAAETGSSSGSSWPEQPAV